MVQLYQDQDFLNRAVCGFAAAAALANGEGRILVPTIEHWSAFRPRLAAQGVDVEAAQERGQLTVVDADELLPQFMRGAVPEAPMFLGPAGGSSHVRAERDATRRCAGGARWSISFGRGNVTASMSLEDLFDQLAHKHDIAIFCSFPMDNFNGEIPS
jgi:hypothetical protein